ncbi:HNH endonuclease [Amycolatopsis orientalis]|uniref:HNH endonuclease n=1 Tax=Amycolatopsis orientalis TaxID=31958 RepID=A0A193C212_AMYOR|nr:HNH endonuclease signature motif containing protein [Amycolatopsis orientalis]ANN18459.1 HNH endonuclease [Amycolatopsis orientalis]
MSSRRTLEPPHELWRAGARELAHGVVERLSLARQAMAEIGQFLVEIEARGSKELFGHGSTAGWYAETARITPAEAQKTLERAQALNPGRNLDGSPVPATAPIAGAAAAEGELGEQQLDPVLTTLKKIPDEVSAEDRVAAEQILVDLAHRAGPREITNAGLDLLAHLDPDGNEPKDEDLKPPAREVSLRKRDDGWWNLTGLLDPEFGARANALFETWGQRRPVDEDGNHDLRTPGERHGDALFDAIHYAMTNDKAPTLSGDRTTVVVTIPLDTLTSGLGSACLDGVSQITARHARMLACDAKLIPAVLGTEAEPLDIGRAARTVTPAQRRALNVRDRHCAFPGCRRRPKHCEAHHILPWGELGDTDLRNLCLLCRYHHTVIHGQSGWKVRMAADGRPEFIPPQYLDPLQKPRRNTHYR